MSILARLTRATIFTFCTCSAVLAQCDLRIELVNTPASIERGDMLRFDLAVINDCNEALLFDPALLAFTGPTQKTVVLSDEPIFVDSHSRLDHTAWIHTPPLPPLGEYRCEVTLFRNADVVCWDAFEFAVPGPPLFDLIEIEAGTFTMGSPIDEPGRKTDEHPHGVTINIEFGIAPTEVTQATYRQVTGRNPSYFSGCDDCPVEWVNWFDAVQFCNRASELDGLDPVYSGDAADVMWDTEANGYRLPTEAEWAYATRAGTQTAFYSGVHRNDSCADPIVTDIAWYAENSNATTHPVGRLQPNDWGLYDTSGNVREWLWDWYLNYPPPDLIDPIGPNFGTIRVSRGGGFDSSSSECRSAERHRTIRGRIPMTSKERLANLGFRVARTLD